MSAPNMSVKEKAVWLIKEYLGVYAANSYENFYAGQKEEVILMSLNELLAEFLGEKKAAEVIHSNFN